MVEISENDTRTLQEWRAINGYTKAYVARQLNVHPSTYAKMEVNPESITVDLAVKLSSLFGCSVKQIVFFIKNPKFKLELAKTS